MILSCVFTPQTIILEINTAFGLYPSLNVSEHVTLRLLLIVVKNSPKFYIVRAGGLRYHCGRGRATGRMRTDT